MSCEAMNMALELRIKELRHGTQRHVTSIRSSNKTFERSFEITFRNILLGRPDSVRRLSCPLTLTSRQRKRPGVRNVMEDEIQQALETIGTEKTPGIDSLPCEVDLRLLHMFIPLQTTVYNTWMKVPVV